MSFGFQNNTLQKISFNRNRLIGEPLVDASTLLQAARQEVRNKWSLTSKKIVGKFEMDIKYYIMGVSKNIHFNRNRLIGGPLVEISTLLQAGSCHIPVVDRAVANLIS